MIKREQWLRDLKQNLETSIQNAPLGNLKIINCRGVEQYYLDSAETRTSYPNGKYLRKSDFELAGKLAQRNYDEKLLSEVEKQLKNFGIDPSTINMGNLDPSNMNEDQLNNIRKAAGFYERYGAKIQPKSCISATIKNDVNDITVMIDQDKVMLYSNKKINLVDAELNEFLLSYKNMFNNKIRVVLCENCTEYDY